MNERSTERQLLRAAQEIRKQLQGIRRTRTQTVENRTGQLAAVLTQLNALRRKLHMAYLRGWDVSAGKISELIGRAMTNLPYCIRNVEQAIKAQKVAIPSVREVLADLQQLGTELGGVSYNPEASVLAVVTEPIELEGVYLGPFEIMLDLHRLADDKPNAAYHIVALDPQPAARNSSVTHPHVSDEQLCEGDAMTPIAAALSTGRICDFFLIVRSVLTTYNSHSPFVPIDEWQGTSCYDCGDTAGGSSYWCSSCENDFCGDCSSYCRTCDESTCLGCLGDCRACDDPTCPTCLARCPDCGEDICKTCLEEGECPCHDNEENDDHDHEDEESQETPPTVEAGGENIVGQFDVIAAAAVATAHSVGVDPA